METINNIASSASKLIYGDPKAESGQEPISGQSGRGTVDEPFDSGNLEGKVVDLLLFCLITFRLTHPPRILLSSTRVSWPLPRSACDAPDQPFFFVRFS
ncbi:hypothetical protein BK809_0008000 [Diplodia seriata]|uniref:Uncharacterized protein n=1 Tax=Diplodia seriata TaxID=420778 RepID=A0A1S8BKC4_9PEZI|nr:hypothetical protein BK809_0008000 [Diplodia seriata]